MAEAQPIGSDVEGGRGDGQTAPLCSLSPSVMFPGVLQSQSGDGVGQAASAMDKVGT